MAVRPARFDFKCEKEVLEFTHGLPSSLFPAYNSHPRADYVTAFAGAIQPILDEHEAACRAASSPQCGQCESPTAKILMTPMSYLHMAPPHHPFVNVWPDPICGNPTCETKSRQQIQQLMALIENTNEATRERESGGKLCCAVCGRTAKTFTCSRCKKVAYCGKEHQKEHWRLHKKDCKAPTSGRT